MDCIIRVCFNMISEKGSAFIWGEKPWLPDIWIFILVLGVDVYFILLLEFTTVTLKIISGLSTIPLGFNLIFDVKAEAHPHSKLTITQEVLYRNSIIHLTPSIHLIISVINYLHYTCYIPRCPVCSHSLVCSENSFKIVGIGPIREKEL